MLIPLYGKSKKRGNMKNERVAFRPGETTKLRLGTNPVQTQPMAAGVYRVATSTPAFIGICATGRASEMPIYPSAPELFTVGEGCRVTASICSQIDEADSTGHGLTHGHVFVTASAAEGK
jgi:hypothetical protein